MSKSHQVDYVPRWVRSASATLSILNDTPFTGTEPQYAPRLPTRLIPQGGRHAISCLTLIDTVAITQRIMTYCAQEAVFGVQFEFSDLRSVNSAVAELSKLQVEPFEQGSFVIPAALDERSIVVETASGKKDLSSRDILDRFVTVMSDVADMPEFAASLGLVNSIEELGRILRRDAESIEYLAIGSSHSLEPRRLEVNRPFVDRVSKNIKRRLDLQYVADAIDGLLIAVDIPRAALKLRLSDNSEVRGTFERTAAENVINSLNTHVSLQGVLARNKQRISWIRVLICEKLDK